MSERVNPEQLLDALASAGVDVETISRLTHYLQQPVDVGVPDQDAALRKVRTIVLIRLKRTVDSLQQLDQEGKL